MKQFLKAFIVFVLFLNLLGAVVAFPLWAGITGALSLPVVMLIGIPLGGALIFAIAHVVTEL